MSQISYREEGCALYRNGHYAAALEAFRSEDTDPAKDPEWAYLTGLCHARLGEYDQAAELLTQVVQSDRNLIRLYQARMLLSWLLAESGDAGEAEQQLRKVLDDGFESPQAWAALGYCQWAQKQITPALESYRKALELDNGNTNAANGLGYLLADSGIDPEEAVRLCRQAVETDPVNVSYRDSLGWALYRAGQTEEALDTLRQAQSERPEDQTIKDHLEQINESR